MHSGANIGKGRHGPPSQRNGHRHNPGQRFFFALFSCFRFLVNLPLLDRPLTAGFFWGLITGDWAVSLGVCLFFELYWLDIFPAGTIIPPNSLAPALASLAVVHALDITKPSLAAVVMLLALPLGPAFAQVERYHRQYENEAFGRLIQWTKHQGGPGCPVALTRRSMLVMLPVNGVGFCLAVTALLTVTHLAMPHVSPILSPIALGWPHLWVVASIGAVLSLRYRPAYVLLGCGVALVLISKVFV